ncbi:hypothetical protein HYX05_03785 [Candidatus Woesearchaeota archaeon]|nr:hypothetical protein [Candidatus Woesearchaeota archaeon]
MELGNLDIYFKESNGKKQLFDFGSIDKRLLSVFLAGIVIGAFAASLIRRNVQPVKSKKSLKNNKR